MAFTPLSRRALLTRAACAGAAGLWTLRPGPGATQEVRGPQAARAARVIRALPGTRDGAPWTYDGTVPGPTIRVRRGEEVRLRLANGLAEATSLHWHGVRTPNAMDGVPGLTQPAVARDGTFDYSFTPPDSGTFWYHPHPLHGGQTGRGLYGLLVVEDDAPSDRDIGLVFGRGSEGFTVNGLATLDIPARRHERLRLRLLNAIPGEVIRLRFPGLTPRVMAIDGQPAEPFLARDAAIMLAPGNRVDLMVDMIAAAGAQTPLAQDVPAQAPLMLLAGGRAEASIARLTIEGGAPARRELLPDPAPLPANPLPARMDFRGALKFDLTFDPKASDPKAPDPKAPRTTGGAPFSDLDGRGLSGAGLFTVKRGRTVMLTYSNPTATARVVHLHGHACRLLDRLDDGWKPFWLDTLLVAPGETVRTSFVADNPGRWMVDAEALGSPAPQGAWFEVD